MMLDDLSALPHRDMRRLANVDSHIAGGNVLDCLRG
jgi:hypothetical protein